MLGGCRILIVSHFGSSLFPLMVFSRIIFGHCFGVCVFFGHAPFFKYCHQKLLFSSRSVLFLATEAPA